MHGLASLEEDGGVDACSPMGGWMGMLGAQDCTAKHAHEATVVTLVVAARGHLDIQPT